VGFLAGFGGVVGLECLRGKFRCLMRASSVFWALGIMGAPCELSFRVDPCGFVWFFLFVGWLCWFLCILPVYLKAPYAF
jgi:hypothetical protein